jgi:putative ABC transport system permease protein
MSSMRLILHSFRAMARYKLRSAFVMLGSLVGVAVLTLVVSIGEGAERKILSTARQLFGASSVMIVAGGNRLMGGPHSEAARLTLDDIEAVAQEIPEIDTWDAQQDIAAASVRSGDASATARILGQTERSARVWERGVTRGEYFDALAVKRSDRVALIGETVARQLFPRGDPLNTEIMIGPVSFKVIGILESFGTDVHGMDRDNEIVIPLSTLMRRLMNVDTIGAARLRVAEPDRAEVVAGEVRRVLRARHGVPAGRPDDFTLLSPLEVQKMIRTVGRVLDVYLPLAASIVLIVGCIVTAALMLGSVNERVSEIGLRRAVGAQARDIRLQFLLETTATMLCGGLGGLALGYLGARLVANHMHWGEVFSWKAVLLGAGVSVLIGLIAGVLPALRAARLNPVDALR